MLTTPPAHRYEAEISSLRRQLDARGGGPGGPSLGPGPLGNAPNIPSGPGASAFGAGGVGSLPNVMPAPPGAVGAGSLPGLGDRDRDRERDRERERERERDRDRERERPRDEREREREPERDGHRYGEDRKPSRGFSLEGFAAAR